MRKLARFDAPVSVVRDMFRDTDSWPQWMPGVVSTRTLESHADHLLVEVVLLLFGRRLVQRLECRDHRDGLRHTQVEGWFRKWEAAWTFQPPPYGHGTTVCLTLDLELPVAAGFFLPRKPLFHWMGRQLEDTLARGRDRANQLNRRQLEPTRAVDLGRPLLQVYETEDGFEVCLAGRTFHVEAWEPPAED